MIIKRQNDVPNYDDKKSEVTKNGVTLNKLFKMYYYICQKLLLKCRKRWNVCKILLRTNVWLFKAIKVH